MGSWLRALDGILRGETTRPSRLQDGRIDLPAGGLLVVIVLLGAFHGVCMGCFALFNRAEPAPIQLLASAVKVPALFLLTLLVTFPSLYVFNALVGSRLTFGALFRLLVASLCVILTVLASLGPIVAFFSLTTSSYPFMVLLNVAVFAVAGVLGLAFLLQTMHRLTLPPRPAPPSAPSAGEAAGPALSAPEPAGALDRVEGSILGRNVRAVFACWIVLFALVGAQMSWVLRPFIGHPDSPFTWFRPRQSHFFEALWRAVEKLLSQG